MAKVTEESIPRIVTWLLMNQQFVSMSRYEDAKFSQIGLTIPQFYIIAAIMYLEPPVTPTDLSHFLDRNLNTITLTLDRMEKAGLVKKKRDLPDRRTLRVSLTAKSKRLFAQACVPFKDIPNEVMSCLSDDELQVYAELTRKIIKQLCNKLDISDINSHRIDTMNYVLSKEDASIKPVSIDL